MDLEDLEEALPARPRAPRADARRGPARPRQGPRRWPWLVGLLLGFVLLVLLAGFGIVWFRASLFRASAPPISTGPSIPEAAWVRFRIDDGHCVVVLPGTPVLQPLTEVPPNASTSGEYPLPLPQVDRTFSVRYMNFPVAALQPGDGDRLRELLAVHRARIAAEVGTNPESVDFRTTALRGHVGGELVYAGSDVGVVEFAILRRWPDGAASVCFLRVQGKGVQRDSPEVERFFRSLWFDYEEGDVGPNPLRAPPGLVPPIPPSVRQPRP